MTGGYRYGGVGCRTASLRWGTGATGGFEGEAVACGELVTKRNLLRVGVVVVRKRLKLFAFIGEGWDDGW